jgi:hypothetical protein
MKSFRLPGSHGDQVGCRREKSPLEEESIRPNLILSAKLGIQFAGLRQFLLS